MAREPFKPVELTEGYRPVAAPVETFVQAQVPSRDTSLQDLARSLSTLGGSLGELVGKRDREAEENDRLRGEAAFHSGNPQGFAQGVASEAIPAQYSQSFLRGFKQAQGDAAGADLQERFSAAYDTWDGKTSTDPEAFQSFLGGFLKDNIKTNDPDVLRGLLPRVRQLGANYQQKHIGDVSRATMQGALETEAARNDQLIKAASSAGLGAKTGMDYAGTFGTIETNRAAALSRGVNKDKYDQQVVDGITSAAIELGDRKILDFLDRKVPGADFTWSNTPYGQDAKRKATDTIDAAGRKAVAEAEEKRKELKRAEKDAVTTAAVQALSKNPDAPLPEELLARGEKVDPTFRVDVLNWRDKFGRAAQTSDPDEMRAVYADILGGGGLPRVMRGIKEGTFKNPEDLVKAANFAKARQEHGPKLTAILGSEQSKAIERSIRERTLAQNDATRAMDPDGMTDVGLAARQDYRIALFTWAQKHPDADFIEQEEAIGRIGAGILGRLGKDDNGDRAYNREGMTRENPFPTRMPADAPASNAVPKPAARPDVPRDAAGMPRWDLDPTQPVVPNPLAPPPAAVPGAAQPAQGGPAATSAPPVAAPVPAPAVAPPMAPAAPTAASPVAVQLPTRPNPPAAAPQLPAPAPASQVQPQAAPKDAAEWLGALPANTRQALQAIATKKGQTLEQTAAEAYQKGVAAGRIPSPAAPAAPTAPAAPGKRTEGPQAPDGTPIETASATSSDDAVTREVIASFRKAVGPAITRDQAAKAPRIEGGAPPTPVPVSLKTEKGSIPVPANSAVAMVDDGPRGHINHGVISLKAPDGSILGQYRFVNGGGGAGTIPHGAYDVTNFRDAASRKAQGLTNLGDTFDLNDVFDARAGRTRTALRIHEAHGDGTLGCIGIQGGAAAWRDFTGKMRTLVEQGGGKYTLVLGSEEGGGGQGQGQTLTAQEGFSRVLGTTGKAVGGYASPALQADTRAARILDFVAGAELNQANGGNYNAYFGNAGSTEDLSRRTLDGTILWSEDRGTKSSATGRYQFMAATLRDLKKTMGLSGREQFTPELQDRMALALLERRGYRDYAAGKLSAEDFANNLAKEWASLPNLTTGRSHYAGDGVNKALVSPAQVRSVLEGTGAFPGARLASVAKTLTSAVGGSGFVSRVRGMFGGGSVAETTSAPSLASEPGQVPAKAASLPAPVQASHERILAGLEPDVAAVVRRAQADNPNLRLAAVSGRGDRVEVRAVGPDGRAIPVGDGDEVGAALQRAAGQLGVGVNWASGTRTLSSSVKKTLKA